MSHATCVITIPAKRAEDWQDYVESVLAAYDENMQVEAYRSYEDGDAEDFWAVSSLREKGLLPAGSITWKQIADAYNAEWGDEGERYFVDENGRAYTMSTYNPQSRWDWWSVGGRWLGYFDLTDEGRKLLGNDPGDTHKIEEDAPIDVRLAVSSLRHAIGPQGTDLIVGVPGTGDNNREPYKVDGGRLRLLDIDGMRARAADRRGEAWDAWQKRVEGTPEAVLWEHYVAQIKAGKITPDEARTQYHDQPRLVRLKETATDTWESWDGYNIDLMQLPREQSVEMARAGAIPGYATIDLEGRWLEAGKMGWWGMGEDRIGAVIPYLEVANAVINALDPNDLLVVIDYHI